MTPERFRLFNLTAKLAFETQIDLEYAEKVLEACGWIYDIAIRNVINTKNIKIKKIMTMEDKNELLLLNIVLKDNYYCNNLASETLGKLVVRHRVLLDEFIKQYELPNSINDPVRD